MELCRKLYMIRLENGDSVILQAANEEEALESSGIRCDVADFATWQGMTDVAEASWRLMTSGLGPQNYNIRELQYFMCTLRLEDDGDFTLALESDEAHAEVDNDYPVLSHTIRNIPGDTVDLVIGQDPEARRYYDAIVSGGVAAERARLVAT
jgi:hypothetical protein